MGNAIRPGWPSASTPPNGPRFEIPSLKEEAVAPLRPALRAARRRWPWCC